MRYCVVYLSLIELKKMKIYLPLSLFSLIILGQLIEVLSHGHLIDPPARGTAWRYGFDTPKDYNDMELFCGGFNVLTKQELYFCRNRS
jgi:hypothetical protein